MTGYTNVSMYGATPMALPLLLGGVVFWVYVVYRWALPRPIAGIPYNKDAGNSILGDVPAMVSHVSRTKQIFTWLVAQNVKLNSPVVQVFCRPLGKPWVVITDFRESQDILMRRTKEFDRSDFFIDIFSGLLPDHHIWMKTNDTFKAHRRLLQDLMTPAFLQQVAAPHVYSAAMDLVKLWEEKLRLTKDHPFSAASDIYHAALDSVWGFTFGTESGVSTTKAQLQLLSSLQALDLPADVSKPANVPSGPNPPAFDAVLTLTESLEVTVRSPLPRLHHWFLRQLPYMRRAKACKDNMIADELAKAESRLTHGAEADQGVRCALDDVLRREFLAAQKEGRPPMHNTRTIYDELFGFILGGHETTSTTITWALKLLADNQEVQKKLRSTLRAALGTPAVGNRNPSVQEITKTQVPYLDAVIEEIARCSLTASGNARCAMTDAEILGHRIPKGTDVFLMGNGPSIFSAPFEIDEELRSEGCRAAKGRIGSWDPKDMGLFNPERWLTSDEGGKEIFDATAGPHLTFGLGPRRCFGRRLAYLQLRLILVLIVWNFQLQKVPDELGGYDAVDKVTHQPQQCYVRLEKAE